MNATCLEVTAIEAQGLSVVHRNAKAPTIENLDLTILRGEIVAILGPSGAGKSSLLRVLAGLEAPAHGRVLVEGRDLAGVHPGVALAFQDPALLPWLTAEQNVAFGLDFKRQPDIPRKMRKARVDAALRSVGLENARALLPAALSGGMAQRVALARCIARQPSALLLDEPFGALDEVTRAEMQRLLLRVVADLDAAVLIVTHDIDEALLIADRIVLLGGTPANVVDAWTVGLPRPRDDVAGTLLPLRDRILTALRRTFPRAEPAYA